MKQRKRKVKRHILRKIVYPNNYTIATLHHSSAQALRIKSMELITGDGRGRRDSNLD